MWLTFGINLPIKWFLICNFCATVLLSSHLCQLIETYLTHWGRDEMLTISQTSFLSAFPWMINSVFWFKCHWSLFLSVQFTICRHWFRQWLGADQATSHYLQQCWSISLTHICGTWGRWVQSGARVSNLHMSCSGLTSRLCDRIIVSLKVARETMHVVDRCNNILYELCGKLGANR